MVVKNTLEQLGFYPLSVELGEVELSEEPGEEQKQKINTALNTFGFELIDDRKSRHIEKVKSLIIDLVHHRNSELNVNLSEYLSKALHHDYTYITNLFTQVEGTTIEQFYIGQKIEKVKELLVYDELTLSEIAFRMNYSSVAYLSNQFKKVTGLTPSYFKSMRVEKRKPIDKV
jgi:AraC-like DNA-binding protein